jgi:hypothetical protein
MTDEQKARELREKIAREFYIALNMNRTGFAREYFEYEYPRLPKEPQYEKQDPINSLPYYYEFADSILSLMLSAVEGIENPYPDKIGFSAQREAFESCHEAVKKLLENGDAKEK